MEVFPTTTALEVFVNKQGSVTLMQDSSIGEDPSIIVIPLVYMNAVIRAIRAAKKEAQE